MFFLEKTDFISDALLSFLKCGLLISKKQFSPITESSRLHLKVRLYQNFKIQRKYLISIQFRKHCISLLFSEILRKNFQMSS